MDENQDNTNEYQTVCQIYWTGCFFGAERHLSFCRQVFQLAVFSPLIIFCLKNNSSSEKLIVMIFLYCVIKNRLYFEV